MSLVPAKCPECGGNINVDGEKRLAICEFCKQPFVVEEAIQNFNTTYNITNNVTNNNEIKADVVNVYEGKESDFIIKGGTLVEYQGESVDVVIPDNVVSIGTGAFKNCAVKSVKIPKSVDAIDDYAFDECKYLKVVEFESTIKNHEIFKGCTAIEEIIYDNMYFWNEETWYNYWETGELKKCYRLREDDEGRVVIPKGTESVVGKKEIKTSWYTAIGRENRGNIYEVVLPDSVEEIGMYAFYEETNLKKINLTDNITTIENVAFSGCRNLENILLPNSLRNIGGGAFDGCSALRTITIPGTIKIVQGFGNCHNLKKVTIEEGVEEIGADAFLNCNNLVEISLPTTLKKIELGRGMTSSDWATIDSERLEIVDGPEDVIRENIRAFTQHTPFTRQFAQKYCPSCGGDYVGMLKKKCTNCGREKPKA